MCVCMYVCVYVCGCVWVCGYGYICDLEGEEPVDIGGHCVSAAVVDHPPVWDDGQGKRPGIGGTEVAGRPWGCMETGGGGVNR